MDERQTDEQGALPDITEPKSFSQLIAEEDADDLIVDLSDATLTTYASGLDQAEADRIWAAAENLGNRWIGGPEVLLKWLLQFGAFSPDEGWRTFNAALASMSAERYLAWTRKELASWSGVADIPKDTHSLLEYAMPLIIAVVPTTQAHELLRMLPALPAVATRMGLLNAIAAMKFPKGQQHPMLLLGPSDLAMLTASVRELWEDKFDPTNHRCGPWTDPLDDMHPPQLPKFVHLLAIHQPGTVELEVGYSAGIRAETLEDIPKRLLKLKIRDGQDAFLPMAQLWYHLKELDKCANAPRDQQTELTGVRTDLAALLAAEPATWVRSLKWILMHAKSIKRDVVDLTVQLGRSRPEVGAALRRTQELPAVSTLSRGILALIEGIARPQGQDSLALADSLAHYFDGTPKFPSPLALRSATWLGSDRLEKYLRDGVSRACILFAEHVLGNIGSQEEALSENLMAQLVAQFSNSEALARAARSEAFGVPRLKLSRREVARITEERVYGCDLAFLVKVRAQDVYAMDWAALVQVKKTRSKSGDKSRADAWTIAIHQLKKLLDICASATFFLICSHGEVLVVPARHLLGFIQARPGYEELETCDLGYNDVRSAAIPLEQYIVDLLIGQWTGSADRDTLDFVTGNADLQPRHVVEVDIAFGPAQQG